MDPTAVNYDSKATTNSNSWCIPSVPGCMDPAAANFAPAATLHTPSMCIVARHGCQDPTAINYNSRATVASPCYRSRVGCLNPNAINYGCTSYSMDSICTAASEEDRVTVHAGWVCKYTAAPPAPPSPPSPSYPPAGDFELSFVVTLVISIVGECPSAIDTHGGNMANAYAETLGTTLDLQPIDIDICNQIVRYPNATALSSRRQLRERRLSESGEIAVKMMATFETAEAADASKATLVEAVGTSRDSLQASFGSLAGVSVTSAPAVTVQVVAVEDTSPASVSAGAIVGAIAGIIAVLLIVGVFFVVYKRGKTYPRVYPA